MARKWDEELREAARKAAQQKEVSNQTQTGNVAKAAAEAVLNRKSTRTTAGTTTKAGTQAPAFGVSAGRGNRASVGLSGLSSARSFEEYARKRRQAEEAEGMKSAAEKLLTATAKSSTSMRVTDAQGKLEEEAEKQRRAAAKEAAENLANQYGYKNVAGRAVYATPFAPLPDPNGERGATKAQAPGAYGIQPDEYVQAMNAIDKYKNLKEPEMVAKEDNTFLHKWFPEATELPFATDIFVKGDSLPKEQQDEFWADYDAYLSTRDENEAYHSAKLAYEEEKATLAQGFNDALTLLGEDAPSYATGREADYYERYRNTMGAKEALNSSEPLTYKGYGTGEGMSLTDAKKYTNSPYAAQGNDRYDLQRWSQTTQQERDAYRLMREMYGEEAAESYLNSLEKELNKRLAGSEETLAKAYAEANPLASNLKTIATAPIRGLGMVEMGVEKLLGKETDAYDPRLNLTREAEAIREKTASGMGGVGGLLYNTGMSMTDSLANMALFGGLGSVATLVSMGGNSAASAFNSAVERGADENQAMTAAVLSGVAEALFEKFSFDNVVELAKGGGLKNAVANVAKQMGIESSEELFTGIANELSDRLVMQENSNYQLAVAQYEQAGMTEEEARRQANLDSAAEIGLGALGGALSGGVMGAGGQMLGSLNERSVVKELEAAAANLAKAEQQEAQAEAETPETQPAAVQENSQEEAARAVLEKEYEQEAETAPQPAQEAAQQDEQTAGEQEQAAEEKPAEEASEGQKAQLFKTARKAMVNAEDGDGGSVNVVGVMMNEGTPVLVTENADGENDYFTADELTFDDDAGELLAYEGVERMDARALRNYLEGYDSELGTAEEYANAYSSIYQRAKSGVDYEQAALTNGAREYLSEDAMLDAYTAGLAAYNQAHDTGSAEVVQESGSAAAGDGVYSIKDENGHKYVNVDTDQQLFDGLKGTEMLKKAREYIVDHFKGKYIGEGDANAYVSGRTAKEYSRPANRRMSEEVQQAKGRAAAELDNLLTVSRFLRHEADDGSHPEATGGWDYYETEFRVNGKTFVGTVNVLNGDGFRTLHDVTGIKEKAGRYEGDAQTSSKQTTPGSNEGAKANGTSADQPRSGFPAGTPDAESTDRTTSIAQKGTKGKLSKHYSKAKWDALSTQERKNALAQMELLGALASRTGRTITIVDSIAGRNGGRANAMYNPQTGEIRVALDAQEGAYAYAAMHELTHAMKHEHKSEWSGFVDYVKSAMKDGGQSWDGLVEYQMNRFGYSREAAEEEVICNTVPALLQDERNVLKLYKGNRKLFDRVVDWVKGLLKDVKAAGEALSRRSESWKQMDALAKDRKALQEIYDRMMEAMEKPGDKASESSSTKYSPKEGYTEDGLAVYSSNFPAGVTRKERQDHILKLVQTVWSKKPITLYIERDGKTKKIVANFDPTVDASGNVNSDATKLAYGNKKGTMSDQKTTEKLADDFPELISGADFVSEKAETGGKNAAHDGVTVWDYFANHIGFINEQGGYAEYNVYVDVKEKAGEHYVYSVAAQKIKGSERSKAPTLYSDPKTIHASVNGVTPAIATNIVAEEQENVNLFSMQDSEGNELTEQQQEYFADSKVRDENGSLLVVYHGTPSGKYEKFRNATYFTPMEWYADIYQNPGASSISYGKKNDAPMTYKAYLNIKKPFDTRRPRERQIFMKEYYRQWGTGAPLSASGLPDWTDGMDLQEFIEEMGYDYDGLILDEGGVPDDKGGVTSRGLSYVIFEPEQAKLVENKTPTDDERFRYSMRDSDENVQEALSAEEKAFAQVKGHRITAAEADKLAGEVLKKANSDYDRQKLAAEISRIYDYVERGEDVDWNQVDDESTRLMARVMEKSRTLNLEHEEMAAPIREYLRKTGIRLTDKQRAEASSQTGSYGAYRKSLFGRVRLVSTGGTQLDSLWGELSKMNAELFPADAREGDMPMLLVNAVDALKPVYETGKGMSMEESASWMAGQMNEAYFSLPAVKAAAKNARTFGQSVAALKDAMKRFEETSWTEYQSALRSIREARGAQQRTRQQEETAARRAKYAKWREQDTAARKERELKTRYRARIERTAQTLGNWLLKPTDAKHVPAGVEDSVRRMLEALDFSGKSTKTARQLSEQLDGLANAMQNAQEGEDENRTIFLERDQQMIDEIRRVAELIRGNTDHQQAEGRGVYDLNGLELRELSKWLDVVKHVVTEASKLRGSNLPGESVEQVAQMSMMEMSRKKAWKDRKWATKQWLEHFGPDMQDSFTFFERLGPTANAVFRGLREGFDKAAQLTAQAEKHTKTILDGLKLSELTGRKARKQVFEVASGKLEMTKAQVMELYVLSRREQAQGHIYGGGIKIQGDEDARPHTLTKKEVAAITGTLTEDEKRAAEGMQRFLSRECANWGNETSMKLLGYRKFGEENYWPIRTDANSRNTTRLEDNYAANINAIKNQGMTKATIEGAKNAIEIGDIFDTYTRHISNMAAYSAYALPLSDFTRWYNSRGVKTEIEQMLGKKGLTYINNFLMAVNGSGLQPDKTGIEKLAGAFTRNAKIASVGANARVVIQQPTSYARAAMYMSPKYLSQALTMKAPSEELVNRYCGIAQWKRWGFYETNVGPNLRQMIVGDDTLANKAREIAMKPAAVGDEWTLNRLWNACELETRELMPELERGSEAYYQQVGRRMSEIIDRTQVVDSVFHRSQMMRSKSGTAQMLTNFMSEPTKTFGLLTSAIYDFAEDRKNKAARNRVARALVVYAVSGLLTAAAAAVIDAFRDEDAEKEWIDKYLDAVGSNVKDNLNPLGLLPGVKDVLSMLEGYESSRMDMQSIQKLIWAGEEFYKYTQGESNLSPYGMSYKIAQALSSFFGIPFSSAMRDVNAVIQTVTGSSITKTPEARKNATLVQLYQAMEEGKTARAKKLREELQQKAGMTPKAIDTALAEMLEEDTKVAEAYSAKEAKDYAAMNRAINALTARGFDKETVDKAISKYADGQKPKAEATKDPNEQLQVTLYSKEDVANAMRVLAGLEKGNVTESDVRAMISERVAGSEAQDPEKTVKSEAQSALKADYLAMEKAGNTAGMKKLGMVMTNVLGTTQDTMDGWVREQHAANLREALDGGNKTAALKAVSVMRKDGKTDSEIKSSLSKYKQLYIDAMKRRDTASANRIKQLLQSLGLKGKNGKDLYPDSYFAELKESTKK